MDSSEEHAAPVENMVVDEGVSDSKPLTKPEESESRLDQSSGKEVQHLVEARGEIPKGKVACPLCRGYITYKNNDRSRFKAHLEEEHEMELDSDINIILAVSVLNDEERSLLVKATTQRLHQVGNSALPTARLSSAFQQLIPASSDSVPIIQKSVETKSVSPSLPAGLTINKTRFPSPQVTRGRAKPMFAGRGRGVAATGYASPRGASLPLLRAPPVLNGINQSISISVVDQRTPCSHCGKIFANNDLMTDHMKAEHLMKFPGLSINTPPREVKHQSTKSLKEISPKPTLAVEFKPSPSSATIIPLNSSNLKNVRETILKPNLKITTGSPSVGTSRLSLNYKHTEEDPKFKRKADVKVKQSHSNVRKLRVKAQKKEKVIDFVDMLDNSDEDETKSSPEKTIKCPQCEKMLATNMALKMHTNLNHPVKTEVTDIDNMEELLADSDDEASGQIKTEVEGMETLELLDNLVNFLESED